MVVTCLRPFGATDNSTDLNLLGQSSPGKTPNAGRFTRALKNLRKKNINNFLIHSNNGIIVL